MGVPEGKRSKGKLNIETECFMMLDYIFNITSKYYQPPVLSPEMTDAEKQEAYNESEQCKWFAEAMRGFSLDCLSQIQEANRIVVGENEDELYDRKKHQDNAERALENLQCAAYVMYRKKKLKSKRLKNIGEQIGGLKRKIQNWRKSDRRRFEAARKGYKE